MLEVRGQDVARKLGGPPHHEAAAARCGWGGGRGIKSPDFLAVDWRWREKGKISRRGTWQIFAKRKYQKAKARARRAPVLPADPPLLLARASLLDDELQWGPVGGRCGVGARLVWALRSSLSPGASRAPAHDAVRRRVVHDVPAAGRQGGQRGVSWRWKKVPRVERARPAVHVRCPLPTGACATAPPGTHVLRRNGAMAGCFCEAMVPLAAPEAPEGSGRLRCSRPDALPCTPRARAPPQQPASCCARRAEPHEVKVRRSLVSTTSRLIITAKLSMRIEATYCRATATTTVTTALRRGSTAWRG